MGYMQGNPSMELYKCFYFLSTLVLVTLVIMKGVKLTGWETESCCPPGNIYVC